MKSELHSFEDLDFFEKENKMLENLSKSKLEEFTNTIILGKCGIGRLTRARILLANFFDKKVFNISEKSIELGKKNSEFNYRRSMYHIEIDLKMNINFSDVDIYEFFLKEYLQTNNMLVNNIKIIIIKSFELASIQFQKHISSLIERNYLTSRFILISEKKCTLNSLMSKLFCFKFPNIKRKCLKNYLMDYCKENKLFISDLNIDDVLEPCFKNDGYFNLDNVFSLFEMSSISGKFQKFYTSYNIFIDNIIEKIFCKKFKFSQLGSVRDSLYNLYTSTIDAEKIIIYINKYLIKKFPEEFEFNKEIIYLSNKIIYNLNISNKDIIHLENYIVGLLTLKVKYLK